MPTASLPPQTEHLPGFVPDADTLYWKLLEEFYSLSPSHVDYGGSRVLAMSFGSDDLSSLTDFAGIEKARELQRVFFRPTTAMIAGMVYHHTGIMPQACSLNLYRNGQDFIAPHTDTDYFLGPDPEDVLVASVSFGASRLFKLERMDRTDECNVLLQSGDLFVMRGTVQREWLHSVPECDAEGARLSLNFLVPRAQADDRGAAWFLSEVPERSEDLFTKYSSRTKLVRALRGRKGSIPRPVYCGSLEEVFVRWTKLEKAGVEELAAISPGQEHTYNSREELLQDYTFLAGHLPAGDPLLLVKSYMEAPNPDTIELSTLPTHFLEEMSSRIEAELNKRANVKD